MVQCRGAARSADQTCLQHNHHILMDDACYAADSREEIDEDQRGCFKVRQNKARSGTAGKFTCERVVRDRAEGFV